MPHINATRVPTQKTHLFCEKPCVFEPQIEAMKVDPLTRKVFECARKVRVRQCLPRHKIDTFSMPEPRPPLGFLQLAFGGRSQMRSLRRVLFRQQSTIVRVGRHPHQMLSRPQQLPTAGRNVRGQSWQRWQSSFVQQQGRPVSAIHEHCWATRTSVERSCSDQ